MLTRESMPLAKHDDNVASHDRGQVHIRYLAVAFDPRLPGL